MQAPHDVRANVPHAEQGVSNNGVIAILLIAMAIGYFACVKPMSDQVHAMRRSMTCMQNRVARLVKEADAAGEGAGLLANLAQQRESVSQAADALAEIEALNRRLAGQTRQIALLASSEDLVRKTMARIVEHRELLGAAESALSDADQLEQRLYKAERQIAAATTAAERMRTLCAAMVNSRGMVEDALVASEDMAALQQRLLIASRETPNATDAVARLHAITGRLTAETQRTDEAEQGLARLESLENRLLQAPDRTARAVETLDVLEDLRAEVVNAEGEFDDLRKVLLEVALMRPALDRAVATLNPIRELATLRYLDAQRLQVAAKALRVEEGGTIAK
ncbi:hypothetical protein Pla123a_37650 [Posidoniimonas polymericola]|uniref:Uncharacterized protein n=1 Tax=Posidoniimonas polymericola TaxID=2528002 RepID=A0A5C5YDJ8_9BACT|nr:hypothetical protein [Posidoniimonas polymericola]TWT73430.1 hypothetical protein Pla123a_37650 [Posidoniimonas polymericola]